METPPLNLLSFLAPLREPKVDEKLLRTVKFLMELSKGGVQGDLRPLPWHEVEGDDEMLLHGEIRLFSRLLPGAAFRADLKA